MSRPVAAACDAPWGERAAVTTVFLSSGLGIGAWAACIPTFKARLSLSDGGLSLALLAFAVGAVVAMPLAGVLAPKLGVGRMTRLGAGLFAGTLMLPPIAGSLPVLIAAVFAMGAAQGVLDVTMNASASEVERRWGLPVMSSFHAAWSGGGLLGAILGGVLGGAPVAMVLAGLVAAAIALGVWTKIGSGAVRPTRGPRFVLPGRAALPLCLAALLCFLCEGAMVGWSAVYLKTATGAMPVEAAMGYAAFAGMMLLGRLCGDQMVRRFGPSRIVLSSGTVAGLGLALAVGLPSPMLTIVGFALVGIGLSNVVPSLFSMAGRLNGSAAMGVAMVATAGYAGFLVGPVLIGTIAQYAGLRAAMGMLVLFAGIVALLSRGIQTPRS
jgi:MFS family permease